MVTETRNNLKKNVANFFGAIGYLSCSMQWLWAIALNFSLIKSFALFVSPVADTVVIKQPTANVDLGSNIFVVIIGIIFVIIMAALTIFILIKMPSTIVKTGKKAVHKAAESLVPLALRAQHKKDNKQNRKKLSSKLVLAIKIILVIAPLILAFSSKFTNNQTLDFNIALIVAVWLAGSSIMFFVAQYLLAKLFKVIKLEIL